MPDGLDGITVEEAVLPRNAEREVSLSVPVSEMPLVKSALFRPLRRSCGDTAAAIDGADLLRLLAVAIPRRCLPAPQAI